MATKRVQLDRRLSRLSFLKIWCEEMQVISVTFEPLGNKKLIFIACRNSPVIYVDMDLTLIIPNLSMQS